MDLYIKPDTNLVLFLNMEHIFLFWDKTFPDIHPSPKEQLSGTLQYEIFAIGMHRESVNSVFKISKIAEIAFFHERPDEGARLLLFYIVSPSTYP